MPPRKKPTSRRKKKADQKLYRAIRRGDAPAPEINKVFRHRTSRKAHPDSAAAIAARKLQSAFLTLPPAYLQQTKLLASDTPLPRPIPAANTLIPDLYLADDLVCPKRPKWRFDMSKLDVEKNEEGVFKKWMQQTDEALLKSQDVPQPANYPPLPRAPSYFERNIEVWRQLSSSFFLIPDAHFYHYPPSLASYLSDRKVILVLTKVDIAGSARVAAWTDYLHKKYPTLPIVQVESYIERQPVAEQGKSLFEPSLPEHFRERLVATIRQVHAELLEPPERVKNDPKKLATWVPPVKKEIDWNAVLQAKGSQVGMAVGGATVPRPATPEDVVHDNESSEQHREPTQLTIGLIGQPNVGKSSLLNAIFGTRKVSASKTPGRTKHFQTLFWTQDVRLVDCPGLVMPSYVPMEVQVLSGILPISRVSAVPACIFFASHYLPLEKIFNLAHPSAASKPPEIELVEDKRTWRDGMKPSDIHIESAPQVYPWTAMDILSAHAEARGWLTAQAGRPDVHRAGNAILRALAEGRIGWGFWPPNTPLDDTAKASSPEQGIWIPRGDSISEDSDPESDGEADHEHGDDQGTDEEESADELESGDSEEEDDDDAEPEVPIVSSSRFGALAIADESESDA